jgi:hypothetical protein
MEGKHYGASWERGLDMDPNDITPNPDDKKPDDEGGNKFVPITTQEDFDIKFNARWAKEKSKYDGYDKFEEYKASHERLSEIETKLESERVRADAAEAKVKDFETSKQADALRQEVAKAEGIDPRLLHGSTKEELEQSAKTVKEVIGDDAAPFVASDGKPGANPGPDAEKKFVKNFFNQKG